MKKYLLVLSMVLSAGMVNATSYTDAKITGVLVGPNYGNTVIVKVDKTPEISGCHKNPGYNYAFDGSTDEGKIYLSVILAAYAAQKSVSIAGYNDQCTRDVENLIYVVAQ